MNNQNREDQYRPGYDIAVIGMSGRFPGAGNIRRFWENLEQGKESISFFTREELAEAGVEPELLDHPDYVRAKGVLEDIESFDASFFNYSPREATLMDPQMRIFHQCVWEAMEDAGYAPGTHTGMTGLYAGAAPNLYWELLSFLSQENGLAEKFSIGMQNNKDYLATKISYNLGLNGPSYTLFTACSTSMVAIHEACQGLMGGECDMALAGGVSAVLPRKSGYLYQEGMILSPDGHCRAFDSEAGGTVFGDGAAAVVLKRIEDAMEQGDHIYAVVRGSAINNDGARKIGYTAPSVEGQVEVIRAAMQMAEVAPADISYIETHGTGTKIGDPIEVEALNTVFGAAKKGVCGIGSVKPNVGHLDVCAGIAGFVKTVLILYHRTIPPSLHFHSPNPGIDFLDGPFYVNAGLSRWENTDIPFRAGVSSFGVGGTNVHAVLQEPPSMASGDGERPLKLLPLSAKTPTALAAAAGRLKQYLEDTPGARLADVAYTLQVGRAPFAFRKCLVCGDAAEAVTALDNLGGAAPLDPDLELKAVFMFNDCNAHDPGAYPGAGAVLYREEPVFRREMDTCFDIAGNMLGYDTREFLFPAAGGAVQPGAGAPPPEILPMLHVMGQYALARLLMDWSVTPAALLGEGAGEYAAAVLSGARTLEQALALAAAHGGAGAYWDGHDHGGVNQPSNPPAIPAALGRTGTWITPEQAADPAFWSTPATAVPAPGLEQCLARLGETGDYLFVETGPGGALGRLVSRIFPDGPLRWIPTLPPGGGETEDRFPAAALSRLWERGYPLRWRALHRDERRLRIPLPTYPFEGRRLWIDGDPFRDGWIRFPGPDRDGDRERKRDREQAGPSAGGKMEPDRWFYIPTWEHRPLPGDPGADLSAKVTWLVLTHTHDGAPGLSMARALEGAGHTVVTVAPGSEYSRPGSRQYVIRPGDGRDYGTLLEELEREGIHFTHILHCWNLTPDEDRAGALERGYYGLIELARALAGQGISRDLKLTVPANRMLRVEGAEEEPVIPERALALAVCRVLPQETPNMLCRCIDVGPSPSGGNAEHMDIQPLVAECLAPLTDTEVAYRDGRRLVRVFEPPETGKLAPALALAEGEPAPLLKERGVYWITGGLGDVGPKLARYLARSVRARLVLTGRSGLPPRDQWDSLEPEANPQSAAKINMIRELEALGAEVLAVPADVADKEQMARAVEVIRREFGAIDGVIHAAGILRVKSGQTAVEKITLEQCAEQFRPKVDGVLVLEQVLKACDMQPDFVILTSSLAPILGGLGHVAYAAANMYLDAFARRKQALEPGRWLSVNWEQWRYSGGKTGEYDELGSSLESMELTPAEGEKSLQALLAMWPLGGNIVVSGGDLRARLKQWVRVETPGAAGKGGDAGGEVFDIGSFKDPRAGVEKVIVDIFKEFYGFSGVDTESNFFDLGVTSLDFIHLVSRMGKALGRHISIEAMFEHPTIRELAYHLTGGRTAGAGEQEAGAMPLTAAGTDIAVIGMAGRFPGAPDIARFWENLCGGTESIAFFSKEELREAGVREEELQDPGFVGAKGYLPDIDRFDAEFFDYSPTDARLMDPQLRIFHECAWGALEDAGYDPYAYPGSIGVFAGAAPGLYWQVLSQLNPAAAEAGQFTTTLLNDKDSLSTQISYKLNLRGPSSTVFTGCSTSLTAIDSACRALSGGQCHMALAGGVTVTVPEKSGYIYREGMLFSSDGHVRSFDAAADGLVFGDGAGVVVLKPLEHALRDRDHVYAVVKGGAVNNDGGRKAGYTSPSVSGQAEVIRAAHRAAGVRAEDFGYVETHGTATRLGDPIEIKALVQAFDSDKKGFCKIGSVKSNIGHLVAASGVAGFIKTVMILDKGLIPPSLHFKNPNPEIDFQNSPFRVNTELCPWRREGAPPTAGVSSFGIGGTNVHVVLQKAPETQSSTRMRHWKMLTLSARTEAALEQATRDLAAHFKTHPDINLPDAAYSLQVGRKRFKYRRTVLCEYYEDAVASLTQPEPAKVKTLAVEEDIQRVVFMFPGQGAQYVDMGRELYRQEPLFREELDRCFELLEPILGYSLKAVVFPPGGGETGGDLPGIHQTAVTQPLVFCFEAALARLLMTWGIRPAAMIGYSFGEYAAAYVAGVFSLEDALRLIALRGKLMNRIPPGAMLSVPLPEEQLLPLLEPYGGALSLGIDNGASCIVGGGEEVVARFERDMKGKKLMCMRVAVTHAAHSGEMDEIMKEFRREMETVTLGAPEIPFISSITGTWITSAQARDPGYWTRHMRDTVRFAAGIRELSGDPGILFMEVGPGRDLGVLAARFLEDGTRRLLFTLRPPQVEETDSFYLFNTLARLWRLGVPIDWDGFYAEEERKRIPLPTYPFQRQSYWLEGNPFDLAGGGNADAGASGGAYPAPAAPALEKRADIADWFYLPQWKRAPWPAPDRVGEEPVPWLVFADNTGVAAALVKQLENAGADVAVVETGDRFSETAPGRFTFNPLSTEDYLPLVQALARNGKRPGRIVHCWGVTGAPPEDNEDHDAAALLHAGFYSLLYLARALAMEGPAAGPVHIAAVTDGMQEVTGEEPLSPLKAAVLGPVLCIPQEFSYLSCKSIDIPAAMGAGAERPAARLIDELRARGSESVVAYRGNYRWTRVYEPVRLEAPPEASGGSPIREQGVYLVTGGLGGIGGVLAAHLAQSAGARLVLTGRTALPDRDSWDDYLETHGPGDSPAKKIRKVRDIEAMGGEVLVVKADAGNEAEMRAAVEAAQSRFGTIHGVIHAAGIVEGDTFSLIKDLKTSACELQFQSKIYGLQVLEKIFSDKPLDFCLLMSSISTVLGGLGYAAYAGANRFMDAFVHRYNRGAATPWTSVDWSDWQYWDHRKRDDNVGEVIDRLSMTPEEGAEAFRRVLTLGGGQIANSPGDLQVRIHQWIHLETLREEEEEQDEPTRLYGRPELNTPYVAPRTPEEETLADIWQKLFHLREVGVLDDFFQLGGDSLKAITASSRIFKALEVEIPVAEFFRLPTVEKMAEYVRGAGKGVYEVMEPAEEREYYALSPAQKRIYILDRLNPGSTVYNDPLIDILEGRLDLERARQAFRAVVRRHDAFRTAIREVNGEPVQVVRGDAEFELHYHEAEEPEIPGLVEQFITPFDLARPPLLRVGLVKTAPDRHVLMMDMHHIITDGVSFDIFVKDFMVLYTGGQCPALPLQYKDYTLWLDGADTESGGMKEQERFWLETFTPPPPVLDMPIDYPRPAVQDFSGDMIRFHIEAAETAHLKELARREGVTLYMILLALYNLLLYKITRQEDIVVGTVAAARPSPDLEQVIGMFVNTLGIRSFPRGELTFLEFLRNTGDTTLKAFENQYYQFGDLVEKLPGKRDKSRNPLFDVLFELQNFDDTAHNLGPLAVLPYDFQTRVSLFDMTFRAVETAGGIRFTVEYSTALYKPSTIQRFIAYFQSILATVQANPNTKLADIELISGEDKNTLMGKLREQAGDWLKDGANTTEDGDMDADFDL